MLPYSLDVYMGIVARLNAEWWPLAVTALLLGAAVLAAAWAPRRPATQSVDRAAACIMALCWGSAGWLFYGDALAPFFFAAPWLQWAFLVQAALLGGICLVAPTAPRVDSGAVAWLGRAFMLYALLALPLVDLLVHGDWPGGRMLDLAPEPTVLFTCGWLLTRDAVWRPLVLLVIPAAVSVIAVLAALEFGSAPEWAVPVAVAAALGAAGLRAVGSVRR